MTEKNYDLKIIKIPLDRSVKSPKPNFPPLNDLELNLLENPKLLKHGVSLIPLKPIKAVSRYSSVRKKDRKKEKIHKKKDDLDDLASNSDSDLSGFSSEEELVIPKNKHRKRVLSSSDEEGDIEITESDSDTEPEDELDVDEDVEDEKHISPEEIELNQRKELLRKFKILRKQYPSRNITQFDDEFADVKSMQKTYDDEMWDIHIDESTESYRVYFMIACMGMEWLGTQWFDMDLRGLTSHHMARRQKYDRLLIELGEKSYSRIGADLPVEIRLLGVMLMETLAFYIGKQIDSKGGPGISQIFSMMTGGAGTTAESPFMGGDKSADTPTRKSRVKGPTISVDEIRAMNRDDKNNEDWEGKV